jgi:hypothetical protein
MPIGAGDNLQEIMLYGSNTGPTTFTFKRQNWEGSTYDASNSNIYSASVFSINTGTGVVTASTDIRSPIFYDSNNTAYYIDAASTSNLNNLTVANDLTVNGNTYLGNAGGDTVYVNDIIRIGATDSGDASLFFGEGSVAGSDYGARWYWDSGYTFTWYTRNAGTDTALFDYVTNDLNYINWRRHFHMQNKEINYNAQIHFNAGTRFVGSSTNYLIFRSDATNAGGFIVQDGNATIKGYIGFTFLKPGKFCFFHLAIHHFFPRTKPVEIFCNFSPKSLWSSHGIFIGILVSSKSFQVIGHS